MGAAENIPDPGQLRGFPAVARKEMIQHRTDAGRNGNAAQGCKGLDLLQRAGADAEA
jgi:hypothetical protein